MIILDATTKSLEIILGEAATTQLPIVTSWADTTTTTFTPGETDIPSNSTTAVTIVAAPAASTQRQLKYMSCQNADNVSHVVTVRLNNNATMRTLCKVTLAVGDQLIYSSGDGFIAIDSNGNRKTSISTADVAHGGTGISTYTIGDIPYASASTTMLPLADVATGSVLTSGGVGVAPLWSSSPVLNGATSNVAASAGTLFLRGGQIGFPATQVASTDVNTLDDYEEGTFTPTIVGSTGTLGAYAASIAVGLYTKVGNKVFFQLYIVLTNKGSWTGNASVSGFPFTSSATSNSYASVPLGYADNLTLSAGKNAAVAWMNVSSTSMLLYENASAAASTATPMTNIANNTGFMITGSYQV